MILHLLAYPGCLLLENTVSVKEKTTVPAEAKNDKKQLS